MSQLCRESGIQIKSVSAQRQTSTNKFVMDLQPSIFHLSKNNTETQMELQLNAFGAGIPFIMPKF